MTTKFQRLIIGMIVLIFLQPFYVYVDVYANSGSTWTRPLAKIASGSNHTLFVTADGQVKVAGSGYYSTGMYSSSTLSTPTIIPGLSNVREVAAGSSDSFALMQDGTVKAWGNNSYGSLGIGSSGSVGVPVGLQLTNVKQIAAGSSGSFTLFLKNDGTVWSTGYNNNGQLGLGHTSEVSTPTAIASLSNVEQIVAGNSFALALLSDGTVKGWGTNSYGQLGTGNTYSNLSPVTVPNLSNVKQIDAGATFAIAVLKDGTVKAWGSNTYGELGLGHTTNTLVPTTINGLTNVDYVSAGEAHVWAQMTDGSLKAWGANMHKQLGLGAVSNQSVPRSIEFADRVSGIYTRGHNSYFIDTDQVVWALGSNNSGMLGTGDTTVKETPTMVIGVGVTDMPFQIDALRAEGRVDLFTSSTTSNTFMLLDNKLYSWGSNSGGLLGLSDTETRTAPALVNADLGEIKQISTGSAFALALMADGTVKSWGSNSGGQLGLGDYTSRMQPVTISGLSSVKQVVTGQDYALALMEDGTVKAWGTNGNGQLGLGNTTTRNTPQLIDNLIGVKQLAAGYQHVMALLEDGTVKTWGYNVDGQLGLNDTASRSIPTSIPSLTNVKKITTGYSFSMALLDGGIIKTWGNNTYGQLGVGNTTTQRVPTTVTALSNVRDVVAGGYSSYAIQEDGGFRVWGHNNYGQLGLNDTSSRTLPIIMDQGLDTVKIVAGMYHVLTISRQGVVKAWGYNANGQLGLGDTTYRSQPTTLIGSTAIRQLVSNEQQSFVLMDDGSVKAWGSGNNGSLGLGDTTNRFKATPVTGLENVKQLAIGAGHVLALLNNGTVKSWGSNSFGQLGHGDAIGKKTPVTIEGLTNVREIYAKNNYSMVIMNDGTVKAWGDNSSGKLGVGDSVNRPLPTTVTGLSTVKQLVLEDSYTMALMTNGTVKAWGSNSYIVSSSTSTPVTLSDLSSVSQLVTDNNTAFAILTSGAVKSWGNNPDGLLGLGHSSTVLTPTTITSLSGVQQIVAKNGSAFAIHTNGTVKAWGNNNNSQLGLNDYSTRNSPVEITGLTNIQRLSTSGSHVLAADKAGNLYAWGANSNGQLGVGHKKTEKKPVQLNNVTGNQIYAISSQSYAISPDGIVKVWGYHYIGLGLGDNLERTIPVQNSALDMPKLLGQGLYRLNIRYQSGKRIIVRYYLDNNSEPLETRSVSLSGDSVQVDFRPFDLQSLAQGEHELRFEATDGPTTVSQKSWFVIASNPVLQELTIQATETSIKAIGKSSTPPSQLAALPFKLTINSSTSSWLTNKRTFVSKQVYSAADIGGSSSRKISTLTDGSWVVPLYTGAASGVVFLRSIDQGNTWTVIASLAGSEIQSNASIVTGGTKVYGVIRTSETTISSFSFDASTQMNSNIADTLIPVSADQLSVPASQNVALAISADGRLHAAWISKNSLYPNSFNVRYAVSVNEGQSWAPAMQLTTSNSNNDNYTNPTIAIQNGKARVVAERQAGSNYSIQSMLINHATSWSSSTVNSSSYPIAHSGSIVDANQTVHVVWTGKDSNETTYNNIFYSQLTSTGTSWSGAERLTVDKAYHQQQPALTLDKNNKLYIVFSGIDPAISASRANIRMRTYDGSFWTPIRTITNRTTTNSTMPFVLQDPSASYADDPIVMFSDSSLGVAIQGQFDIDASFTLNNLKPNTKYPVKLEVKDVNGNISVTSREVFTRAQAPVLTLVSNEESKTILSITDSNPAGTKYQVRTGNRYVNSEGNLTASPSWITVQDKRLTIHQLVVGNAYSFTIKAANEEGVETVQSLPLNLGASKFGLDVPGNLKVQASHDMIIFSWNPVSDALSYEVEIDGGESNGGGTTISFGNSVEFYHEALQSNTVHSYRVRAVNDSGKSEWSPYVQAKTSLVIPSTVLSVTDSVTSKSVSMSWGAVPAAVSYEIEWDGQIKNIGLKNNHIERNLQPGTQHTYRIRMVNRGGKGPWSILRTIATQMTVPSTPSAITSIASDKSIRLQWSDALDASRYDIEADGVVLTHGPSNYAELKGLIPGTAHQYRVRSVNEVGPGPWSSTLAINTYPLPTPTTIREEATETTVKLTWDALSGVTGYDIEFNGQVYSTATNSYERTSLAIESRNSYRVRSKSSVGTGGWTSLQYVTTLPTRPNVPNKINALANKSSIYITWEQVTGAIGYDIEIDGSVVVDTLGQTNYLDVELDTFSTHTYRVRSRTDAIEGEWSPFIDIRTLPDKPGLPQGIRVTSTPTVVNLFWTADPSASSYDVEVNGLQSDIGLKTEYKHRRVAPGSEHRYRIRMNNQAGVGEWSGLIINNTLTARLTKGLEVDLGLTASNVVDFSKYTLTVTYDPNAISIVDLSTLTGTPELAAGKIEGTDITVQEFVPGSITFTTDRAVKPGESWSGVINSIKMKAKVSGGSSITYTVYVNP